MAVCQLPVSGGGEDIVRMILIDAELNKVSITKYPQLIIIIF